MKGASISIQSISKSYGNVAAVQPVSLDILTGEFLSLLGPSGSGKTTLLMILAGFEQPDSGRVQVDHRDVTFTPPNRRNIGMVFQKYALFPHMTVFENITYPLKMRNMPRDDIRRRVAAALDLVRLGAYGERMPSQLSGGQQQRVALARAMIYEPPLLLMDEPLGALDKKLREQMQIEIMALQERLGVTVIYVTHDQEEALTMSNRIVVMNEGRFEQIGTPSELYRNPDSPFVADFIGKMNFISGEFQGRQKNLSVIRLSDEHTLMLDSARDPKASEIPAGEPIQIAVRPESLGIESSGQGGDAVIPGVLQANIFLGTHHTLIVDLSAGTFEPVHIHVPVGGLGCSFAQGDNVDVVLNSGKTHIFQTRAATT